MKARPKTSSTIGEDRADECGLDDADQARPKREDPEEELGEVAERGLDDAGHPRSEAIPEPVDAPSHDGGEEPKGERGHDERGHAARVDVACQQPTRRSRARRRRAAGRRFERAWIPRWLPSLGRRRCRFGSRSPLPCNHRASGDDRSRGRWDDRSRGEVDRGVMLLALDVGNTQTVIGLFESAGDSGPNPVAHRGDGAVTAYCPRRLGGRRPG